MQSHAQYLGGCSEQTPSPSYLEEGATSLMASVSLQLLLLELVLPSASGIDKPCPAALAPAPVCFTNAGDYNSGHACYLCYLSGSFANPPE